MSDKVIITAKQHEVIVEGCRRMYYKGDMVEVTETQLRDNPDRFRKVELDEQGNPIKELPPLPPQRATHGLGSALYALDPNEDQHWEENGDPSLEVLRIMTGNPSLPRATVRDITPGFNRKVAAMQRSHMPPDLVKTNETTPPRVTILQAVQSLNPYEDEDWTTDGLPKVDSIKALTGDEELTRAQIEQETGGFNRVQATEQVASQEG